MSWESRGRWGKQTAAEKAQAYEDRRSVRPAFTPAQAQAIVGHLKIHARTHALGTVLNYAIREMERAIAESESHLPNEKGTK